MRLIDLDKVVTICDEDNNAVIFTNIKNAEVKAIPVEWIQWYLKQIMSGGNYTDYNAISVMLEEWEWESENANDKT